MRAAIAPHICSASEIELTTVEDPEPGDGQVLVAVKGSGVCHHDVIARRGGFPRTAFPVILGHEIAGEIVKVGDGVRTFSPGDRVATIQLQPCGTCVSCRSGNEALCRQGAGFFGEEAPGGYAEFVVADVNAIVPLPGDVPEEIGCFLACAVGTALHAICSRAKLVLGETVLVAGASGGVGTHAIQLSRLAGARVIAVTSSPDKADLLADLGAHDVSPDLDFASDAKALTDGVGVDAVLEIVGERAFRSSVGSLRPGGRLVFIGNVTAAPVRVAPALTILKELTLMGAYACNRQELAEVIELVRRGQVTPVVHRTLALADATKAHQLLEENRVRGRLVLVP